MSWFVIVKILTYYFNFRQNSILNFVINIIKLYLSSIKVQFIAFIILQIPFHTNSNFTFSRKCRQYKLCKQFAKLIPYRDDDDRKIRLTSDRKNKSFVEKRKQLDNNWRSDYEFLLKWIRIAFLNIVNYFHWLLKLRNASLNANKSEGLSSDHYNKDNSVWQTSKR